MSNDKKPNRIKLTKKTNQVSPKEVQVVPSLDSLLSDALSIIGNELSQYRSKSARGVTLDLKEARIIQGYVDSLTKAQKESREQARAQDLSNLSDSELLQLATQLAGSKKLPPEEENE